MRTVGIFFIIFRINETYHFNKKGKNPENYSKRPIVKFSTEKYFEESDLVESASNPLGTIGIVKFLFED